MRLDNSAGVSRVLFAVVLAWADRTANSEINIRDPAINFFTSLFSPWGKWVARCLLLSPQFAMVFLPAAFFAGVRKKCRTGRGLQEMREDESGHRQL